MNRCGVVAACAAVVSWSAAAHGATQEPVRTSLSFKARNAQGQTRIDFKRDVLDAIRSSSEESFISIPIDETESLILRLKRFDVIASGAKFISQGTDGATEMNPPSVVAFRGSIEGQHGSSVYLAFSETGQAFGSIRRTSGQHLWLRSAISEDGSSELMLSASAAGLPCSDLLCESPAWCSPPNPPMKMQTLGQPPDAAKGPRLLRIAIDGDQSFVQVCGSAEDAHVYIVMLIGAISDIYLRDLNLRLQVGFSRVWPDGGEPFDVANLSSFRNHWLAHEDMSGLNLFHLLRGAGGGGLAFYAHGCSDQAFAKSQGIRGWFPTPVGQPHLGNWDVMVVAHEIGHNLGALHTFDMDPPVDNCTTFSATQRGTIMSYCNLGLGGMLNMDMRFHARSAEMIDENNSLPNGACLFYDCNGNGNDDSDDIATLSSIDSNANGIPDECEDCNGNGVLDPDDIAGGAADIDANGLPDACEADCNANAIPDKWETTTELAADENGNWIPDECEPDCDGNRVADFKDIDMGTHADVDRNSVPDVCQDCNENGVTDWDDMDRQFFIWVPKTSGVVECHSASYVPMQTLGESLVASITSLEFGPDGCLYAASFNSNRIVRFDLSSGTVTDFVTPVYQPNGLTFGPEGDLYVSSYGTSSVLRYDGQTGQPLGAFVPDGAGGLEKPFDLVFHPNGNLLVVSFDHAVLQFDGVSGQPLGNFGNADHRTLNFPRSLAFLPNGNLVVTNMSGPTVVFSATGELVGPFGSSVNTWGMTVGPNGNVFTTGASIREFDGQTGQLLVNIGVAGMTNSCIAFRPASPADVNGNNILDECEVSPCVGDIAQPHNGVVDVDDLLTVINSWGECPLPPLPCVADISMNNMVDVDDLLTVINRWGKCP